MGLVGGGGRGEPERRSSRLTVSLSVQSPRRRWCWECYDKAHKDERDEVSLSNPSMEGAFGDAIRDRQRHENERYSNDEASKEAVLKGRRARLRTMRIGFVLPSQGLDGGRLAGLW
ncbi:unnamed protein product [Vitrella brassicaformis CCMP3155]|uniref:Uncharacterized protein n=1 Tax=Vitrella brassicaformis (strain CCMP3155) TaxID=1169540 RepID=A0A0G4EIG1_VITBC|nr:unnamed protein product [Vitrella brassicaformis CCMP3155]|eukprot:CEL95771.1 unnamed protein product [Vitrella brassicaformis CCMP3155]